MVTKHFPAREILLLFHSPQHQAEDLEPMPTNGIRAVEFSQLQQEFPQQVGQPLQAQQRLRMIPEHKLLQFLLRLWLTQQGALIVAVLLGQTGFDKLPLTNRQASMQVYLPMETRPFATMEAILHLFLFLPHRQVVHLIQGNGIINQAYNKPQQEVLYRAGRPLQVLQVRVTTHPRA